jgi:hypothetical protein
MQRRESGSSLKPSHDRIVNDTMPPELRPAVHNAMPDGGRRRHIGVGKKPSDAADGVLWTGDQHRLGTRRILARMPDPERSSLVAYGLSLARDQHLGSSRSDAIQSEFKRGTAAVQREDSGLCSGACHALLCAH